MKRLAASSTTTWLVTGSAGFIGSNFVLRERERGETQIVSLDKLTYAASLQSLNPLDGDPGHVFVQGDIADRALVTRLLNQYRPVAVINFAAESHVDRSIAGPAPFIETNVLGTCHLLEAVLAHWKALPEMQQRRFRFLQISTDEVYGSLAPGDPPSTERSPYVPSSPYAASKAAADQFVRAYHRTYGLPVLTTIGSNTYGPHQFPEKLIPLMIANAMAGEPLPVYGDGRQVRDWLAVSDHCDAVRLVLERGRPGETYHVAGQCERVNLEVVQALCTALDEAVPGSPRVPHAALIKFVADRPGHDRRYALDIGKISGELGWSPHESFAEGIAKTVRWYLDHADWVQGVRSGNYRDWMRKQYGQRLEAAR